MRHFLNQLYRMSGMISATFLVLICVVVSSQVLLNLADKSVIAIFGKTSEAYKTFNGIFGSTIPSYAEFSGYFLAAATFFGLAYTLRQGGHIRVVLFLEMLPRKVRTVFEMICASIGAVTSGFVSYHMLLKVYENWKFDDLTDGIVVFPIWIPRSALVIGSIILTIALLDELYSLLKTGKASYEGHESAMTE